MVIPADPAAVRDALAELRRLGGYFAVTTEPGAGWRPVRDLHEDTGGCLTDLVEQTRQRLGTAEQRVAGSILQQGYAARLWSVTLGPVLTSGVLPDLPDLLWRSTSGSLLEFALPAPTGWCGGAGTRPDAVADRLYRTVVDGHLDPLGRTLGAAFAVSPRILAGNGASALVGTLRVLPAGSQGGPLLSALLRRPGLLGTGTLTRGPDGPDGPAFARNSCCLYYRVPGGGLCGDCVLLAGPVGPAEPSQG